MMFKDCFKTVPFQNLSSKILEDRIYSGKFLNFSAKLKSCPGIFSGQLLERSSETFYPDMKKK